jgi:hypothetical protein
MAELIADASYYPLGDIWFNPNSMLEGIVSTLRNRPAYAEFADVAIIGPQSEAHRLNPGHLSVYVPGEKDPHDHVDVELGAYHLELRPALVSETEKEALARDLVGRGFFRDKANLASPLDADGEVIERTVAEIVSHAESYGYGTRLEDEGVVAGPYVLLTEGTPTFPGGNSAALWKQPGSPREEEKLAEMQKAFGITE